MGIRKWQQSYHIKEKEVLLVLSFPESDYIQIVILNVKLVVVTPLADADLGGWVG